MRWVFVHDLTGTHRDEYFFTTDSTMSLRVGDRDLYGPMEHRDDISRSTLLPPPGDDARLEPEHGAASRPVPVRAVYGRGVAVRGIAGAVSRVRVVDWPGKRDVTFSDAITAVRRWLVAGVGFCDPRSSRSLLKTQPPIPANPAQRPGSRGLRPTGGTLAGSQREQSDVSAAHSLDQGARRG